MYNYIRLLLNVHPSAYYTEYLYTVKKIMSILFLKKQDYFRICNFRYLT